jgi:uncharacterized protein (UPF0276 family)
MHTGVAQGVGIGLRAPHFRDFLDGRPSIGWVEVHTENYLACAGWDWHVLRHVRRDYPVSLHGVGLGLGSADGFSEAHLARVRALVDAIEPALISEHLSWNALRDRQFNDLLPLRLDRAALDLVAARIGRVQDALGRRILVENVSTYLRFAGDALSEAAFLAALAQRTGCGVLLDVNNLYVNQHNHGEDPLAALAALPRGCVGEIHLGGHLDTGATLIDHHGDRVAAPVWDLFRAALNRFGAVPALIEWDTDVPPLAVLLEEAATARRIVHEAGQGASGHAEAALWMPPARDADADADAGPGALSTLQQAFGAALLDPAQDAALAPQLTGDPHRLAIYRVNLDAHWQRALASSYPVLRACVGAAGFAALAHAYGRASPAHDPDLNRFGALLPRFLAGHALAAAQPYLTDVARLDWDVHTAWYAADAAADGRPALAGLTPDAFEASRAVLHPALRLHASSWATLAVWRAHQPGAAAAAATAAAPADLRAATYALVLRPRWQVEVRAVSAAEHAALSCLAAGGTFGAALDAAFDLDEAFDVGTHLGRWLGEGIVTAIVSGGAAEGNSGADAPQAA